MNNCNYVSIWHLFEDISIENVRVIRLISLIRICRKLMDRQTDKHQDRQTNMTDYPKVAEGAYDNKE